MPDQTTASAEPKEENESEVQATSSDHLTTSNVLPAQSRSTSHLSVQDTSQRSSIALLPAQEREEDISPKGTPAPFPSKMER